MSTYLGSRQATGVIDNTGQNPYGNGFWCCTFDSKVFAASANAFEIYHIALKGPSGSKLEVWVDRTFYDTTPHGDVNSWDPNETLHLMGGQTLYFYWNSANAPAPMVTVWLRTSDIL